MPVFEMLDPFLSDKLAVGDEGIDTISTGQTYKSVDQPSPLSSVGIAAFIGHGEERWKCDTLVCRTEHKDIDVDLAGFPVGAVKAKNRSCLDRQRCKYSFGDKVKVGNISGKGPLQVSQVGITFYARRHRRRHLVEADSLHNAKSVKDKRRQLYAGKIHHRARMLLHNRDDLINFVAVSGSCRNFHGEMGKIFFKVTDLQGLLQGTIS